jgi:hypothetical protein
MNKIVSDMLLKIKSACCSPKASSLKNSLNWPEASALSRFPQSQYHLRQKAIEVHLSKKMLLAFLILISASNRAIAKEIKFNDLIFEATDLQKIDIIGAKGTIKLVPAKAANAQKLVIHARKIVDDKKSGSADSWNFSAKREEKTIKIEVRGPDSVTAIEEMKQPSVEFYFEVEAPSSLAVEISLRTGLVSVLAWNAPLNMSVIDGMINVAQCTSSVRIQNQSGEIKISNQKGRLDIDSMKAKIFISDSEGSLRIKNFAGENTIQNVSSSIHVQSKLGSTHITKSQGSIELENGKGSFNILDFNGSIHGQNEDGAITAKLLGDVDVAVDSLTGPMSFKLPEKSAAYAKLQSDEGLLAGLDGFKNAKLGNAKLLIGRFAGSEKGSIVLKSKSGNLRVH